jgi:hypothetical protein
LLLQVAYQLNVDVPSIPDTFVFGLAAGHPLNPVSPIFREISKEEIAHFRATFSGSVASTASAGDTSVDFAAKNTKKAS